MKKMILNIAFPALALSCPSVLVASPKPIDFSRHAGATGLYASVQYKYALPYLRGFLLESDGATLDLFAAKQEGPAPKDVASHDSFQGKYVPSYLDDAASVSVSAGYSAGSIRFEAEGSRQKFLVNGKRFENVENAYKFAASKPNTTSNATAVQPPASYYVSLLNKEFSVISLVANACYDLFPAESKLMPSACLGMGVSFAKFLGVLEQRWSYQVKVGMQYFVTRRTIAFVSGFVDKISGSRFEKVHVQHHVPKPAAGTTTGGGSGGGTSAQTTGTTPQYLYPNAKLSPAYYGVECGVRIVF